MGMLLQETHTHARTHANKPFLLELFITAHEAAENSKNPCTDMLHICFIVKQNLHLQPFIPLFTDFKDLVYTLLFKHLMNVHSLKNLLSSSFLENSQHQTSKKVISGSSKQLAVLARFELTTDEQSYDHKSEAQPTEPYGSRSLNVMSCRATLSRTC